MGEIIEFKPAQPVQEEELYLEDMTREQLEDYRRELEERIQALDEKEPKNMNSERYELWAEEHEALEDALDEVVELLEEME